MSEQALKIGRVAKQAGVGVDIVRYYEQRGLIPPPPRRPSEYRMYPPEAVKRIQFIKRAQEFGFTLRGQYTIRAGLYAKEFDLGYDEVELAPDLEVVKCHNPLHSAALLWRNLVRHGRSDPESCLILSGWATMP